MSVPMTLALLPAVVAPLSSNRCVPTSVTPLMPDAFSLGGVPGLTPDRVASWVGVAIWLAMGEN